MIDISQSGWPSMITQHGLDGAHFFYQKCYWSESVSSSGCLILVGYWCGCTALVFFNQLYQYILIFGIDQYQN